MEPEEMVRNIKSRLEPLYAERLAGVVLYGSEARGEPGPDSDIDVLVLLAGPVDYAVELRRVIHTLYPLTLQWGRPVSPKVVSAPDYENEVDPLYERAHHEGVAV